MAPQLATLVGAPPQGADWLHELKLDGMRLICHVAHAAARLYTRRGNDWTATFSGIARAVGKLNCQEALLDGEAVALDAHGVARFQLLQRALGQPESTGAPVVYYVFDLLYLDGYDLRGASVQQRKALLASELSFTDERLRYLEHVRGRGEVLLREACRAGAEGIVSKHVDATYHSGRSRSWLKTKCRRRQELVIVGFTEPRGAWPGFGALLLASRAQRGGPLQYVGKVGSGFDVRTRQQLHARLRALEQPTAPLAKPSKRGQGEAIHWVRPELVAEVAFSDWTRAGLLRQAVFCGLRADKSAREVVTEQPTTPCGASTTPRTIANQRRIVRVAGVALSHPDKVLYPQLGLTKYELARYYERLAPRILPHLLQRPLTLLRCPNGWAQGCFFQKDPGDSVPAAVSRVRVPGHDRPRIVVDSLEALMTLVQLGTLEFHVWGARSHALEQPDTLVWDLDPAADVSWRQVAAAACLLRQRLWAWGLVPYVRLTGGKGAHVVVPIEPGPSWNAAKRFTEWVARSLVREAPNALTASMAMRRRAGRVYIDYLRNTAGATAVVSYSSRAAAGAPVAMPVDWEMLETADSDTPPRFGVVDVPEVMAARRVCPWDDFERGRRSLTPALLAKATT